MTVDLPPLRARSEDILLLAARFLGDFHRLRGIEVNLTSQARAALMAEEWRGNVRELRNTIERAAYMAKDGQVEPSDLHLGRRTTSPNAPPSGDAAADGVLPIPDYSRPFKEAKQDVVDSFEREYFRRLLAKTDNNLSRAAGESGITRYYLRELLKRLGMHKSSAKEKS